MAKARKPLRQLRHLNLAHQQRLRGLGPQDTPFFPAWRARLARLGSRTTQAYRAVRAYTLCQLENAFAPWVPPALFPKAPDHQNSRDHHYTRWRTFWSMVWQALHPLASGREVVQQLQALFDLEDGPQLSTEDGAHCRAKARLPLDQFAQALAATAKAADQLAPAGAQLQGRPVKATDGSALTLNDTPKNRKAYPPLQCADQPAFPMMRILVLFSLLSGAILAVAEGSLAVSELSLLSLLSSQLSAGDILLADRGFGYYAVLAWLPHGHKVDFIGRSTRRLDGRQRLRRLGRNDWLFRWDKPRHRSPWLTLLQWAGLPSQLTVRVVKGSCYRKGFRVRQAKVVTTLLDPELYPAREILEAYLRRWRLEMCLDDLKTTLEMEFLRGRSPAMVRREAHVRLIAHNLIRCTIAQAATQYQVELNRISFKGTLDALRHFVEAMAQASSKRKRQRLWDKLLQTIATDLVPERPGRREPRAIKRKNHKYPRLNVPRHQFRDHPKRNTRRKNARLRKLGLLM